MTCLAFTGSGQNDCKGVKDWQTKVFLWYIFFKTPSKPLIFKVLKKNSQPKKRKLNCACFFYKQEKIHHGIVGIFHVTFLTKISVVKNWTETLKSKDDLSLIKAFFFFLFLQIERLPLSPHKIKKYYQN